MALDSGLGLEGASVFTVATYADRKHTAVDVRDGGHRWREISVDVTKVLQHLRNVDRTFVISRPEHLF